MSGGRDHAVRYGGDVRDGELGAGGGGASEECGVRSGGVAHIACAGDEVRPGAVAARTGESSEGAARELATAGGAGGGSVPDPFPWRGGVDRAVDGGACGRGGGRAGAGGGGVQ